MTTASVNIPAGWYAVAGTNDVRWWDGRSFREVTLVDGVPRYRFAWGLPAGNYLLGAVIVLVFGVVSLFVGDSLRGGGWLVLLVAVLIAVGFGVVGVLAMQTLRLPPPTGEPVQAATVQPLPGAAEPGPIAPGGTRGPRETSRAGGRVRSGPTTCCTPVFRIRRADRMSGFAANRGG